MNIDEKLEKIQEGTLEIVDIEELKDFLEEVDDPEEAMQWLEEHGAKPHKGE